LFYLALQGDMLISARFQRLNALENCDIHPFLQCTSLKTKTGNLDLHNREIAPLAQRMLTRRAPSPSRCFENSPHPGDECPVGRVLRTSARMLRPMNQEGHRQERAGTYGE